MAKDVERGNPSRTRRPKGYPSLADMISQQDEKNNVAIYRHYDDLGARNILYLQAELAELRVLQSKYHQEDAAIGQIKAKERVRNWPRFK